MPEMTGIELVEKVRQLYESKDLPILMVTTQQEDQDHQAAFKAGVNQLIAKPFKEEDLAGALTVML